MRRRAARTEREIIAWHLAMSNRTIAAMAVIINESHNISQSVSIVLGSFHIRLSMEAADGSTVISQLLPHLLVPLCSFQQQLGSRKYFREDLQHWQNDEILQGGDRATVSSVSQNEPQGIAA